MTTASIVDNFPALHQSIGDKYLVYLDSAATTQKPQSVIDAVTRYYEHDNANIHRGVHTLSQRATQSYENARKSIASLLGANRQRKLQELLGVLQLPSHCVFGSNGVTRQTQERS